MFMICSRAVACQDTDTNYDVLLALRSSFFLFCHVLERQIRSWKDDRHSVAYDMQPITDFNEVTMHFLEIIYTHLFNTKGPLPGKATIDHGRGMMMGGQTMQVSRTQGTRAWANHSGLVFPIPLPVFHLPNPDFLLRTRWWRAFVQQTRLAFSWAAHFSSQWVIQNVCLGKICQMIMSAFD